MSNSRDWDPPGWPLAPDGSGLQAHQQVPAESGAFRRVGEAYAGRPELVFPQSLVERFDARFTDIYGARGVEVSVSLIRDARVLNLVQDHWLGTTVTSGCIQLGVRASRRGHWQAYYAEDHSVANLPYGESAVADLGTGQTTTVWWFFPEQPGTLLMWLFVYGNGIWVPFDPSAAFPHRVDSNGGLRFYVPD